MDIIYNITTLQLQLLSIVQHWFGFILQWENFQLSSNLSARKFALTAYYCHKDKTCSMTQALPNLAHVYSWQISCIMSEGIVSYSIAVPTRNSYTMLSQSLILRRTNNMKCLLFLAASLACALSLSVSVHNQSTKVMVGFVLICKAQGL